MDHSGAVGATKEKDELLPQPAIALAIEKKIIRMS